MDPVEAIVLGSRQHYSIAIIFLIGYLLHVGLQVDAIVRSETNEITSRWFVVQQNALRLAARFFVSLMGFLYIWNYPSTVPVVLGYMGVSLSGNAIAIMTMPINPPVAGFMGFAVDTFLAYVPWLKNQLPPIEYTKVETTVKTTIKETKSVQETAGPAPVDASTTEIKP